MNVPDPLVIALLGIAAYRIWRLLAEDDFPLVDRPRRYLLRLGGEWEKEGDPVPDNYRVKWATFLTCPWCAGFWIALLWWTAWQVDAFWTECAASLFVIATIVPALAKLLTSEEE